MEKILLLGGSAQQIIAIETAKRLGYYTVLCDFLPDNPGRHVADKFYLVSTTDKEAVLKTAKDEAVHGVLAYASDPAAPTAAYVAEQLNLPTNPYESVRTLCNKGLFRVFLRKNGFHAPFSREYKRMEAVLGDEKYFQMPVIIKPIDSSGSKGVTVLYSWDRLGAAFSDAMQFSRCGQVIVEEFIEKNHPYLVGGDIFISNGEVVLWGLLNCHRDNNVNPLVPVGKSYPVQLIEEDVQKVKAALTALVNELGIRNGEMNVELVVDKKGDVWPIDIGPRAGGNMIPDLLGDIFGVDVVDMSIRAAMGDRVLCISKEPDSLFATYNIHSDKDGIYKAVLFSDSLEPYIYRKILYKKPGDKIAYFDNASKCLGIIFMKFRDIEEQREIMNGMKNNIIIVLDSD